jgi:hypothetical protein
MFNSPTASLLNAPLPPFPKNGAFKSERTLPTVIIAVVVLIAYGAYQLLGERIAAIVRDIAGKL